MNRIVACLALAMGAMFFLPTFASADCGCGCEAAPVVASACDCGCHSVSSCDSCNVCQERPRTRLRLTRVCKEVCRTKLVCTTDACGCRKMARVKVKKSVPRLRLVRVEVPKRTRCCKAKTSCCDTCSSCQSDCGCGCN